MTRTTLGAIAVAILSGCAAHVPIPPPGADNACVQACQRNHAICLQGTSAAPAGAYGTSGAAAVGGMLQLVIAQSGRNDCADALQSCFAGCGTTMTQQQA